MCAVLTPIGFHTFYRQSGAELLCISQVLPHFSGGELYGVFCVVGGAEYKEVVGNAD